MEGKVFTGKTERGTEYTIRYIAHSDASEMCDYINTLSKEHTFIRFQGEEMTLADEEKFVQEEIDRIDKKQSVMLLVIVDNKVIGIAGVDMKDKVEGHEGVLGISLAKEYRGQGIGKIFLRVILEEAEKHLPQLKIVSLGVFENNSLAISLYEKFGFTEHGRLPKGIAHQDKFVDHIFMHKIIRE